MKKKLFLAIVMAAIFVLTLAFAVSADSVHNENTVDYSATVTLDDGTVCELFDDEGNALIWYISGTQDGKNIYTSIRADDASRVTWKAESWDEVQSWDALLDDGTTSIKSKIVVINLMDDDVVRNTGNASFLNKPMNNFKKLFENMKNLEYCYLRLDTNTINTNSFNGCSKLKYINLEDLTQLNRMAQNNHFSGCTSLFDGQVLDLTRTKLSEFEGSSTFSGVPFKGVKFPETMVKIGSGTTFNNCTKLEFISIGNKAKFYNTPFSGCTSLKAIYYVGSLDELNASTVGSVVTDATVRSYAEYKSLPDKSGVYVVYNYSRCEAFNQGVHGETTAINRCLGTCVICGDTLVNHTETENLTVTIEYSNYTTAGTKTTVCLNTGCTYSKAEEAPALFENKGYSSPVDGRGEIAICFIVNRKAIGDYEEATGKTLEYGVFAAVKANLGSGDALSTADTIKAEASHIENVFSFELKITGFETDEHKDAKLAIGAYVIATKGESAEVSYLQVGTPAENESYSFVSYNDIVNQKTQA